MEPYKDTSETKCDGCADELDNHPSFGVSPLNHLMMTNHLLQPSTPSTPIIQDGWRMKQCTGKNCDTLVRDTNYPRWSGCSYQSIKFELCAECKERKRLEELKRLEEDKLLEEETA